MPDAEKKPDKCGITWHGPVLSGKFSPQEELAKQESTKYAMWRPRLYVTVVNVKQPPAQAALTLLEHVSRLMVRPL